MRVFVDSDVIISSLLSRLGAAFLLINSKSVELHISSLSKKELEIVTKRLGIKEASLEQLITNYFKVVSLPEEIATIKKNFKKYVLDIDDAHIIAGARAAGADFLITYNLRDYKIGKIHKDLNIITLTPGNFLQYIRSIK